MANNKETFLNLTSDKRETTIYGLPADGRYRVEIEAFRVVDQDIDADGVIESAVAVAPASPYQPSPTVSLGDGVLSGGTPIKTVVDALKNNAGQIIQVKELLAGFTDLEATFGNTATSKTNADAAEAAKLVAQAASTNATNAYTDSQAARDAAQSAQALAAGSATNANTSAANAAQAKLDAQSARDAAQAASVLANGYNNQAANNSNSAAQALSAAQTARDAAIQKAADAATSASNANGSATTASGQSTIATQKASDAGQSASTATAKADIATTKAGEAVVSSQQASTSASNALGSANAASASQTVSATSAAGSLQAALSTMPSDFSQGDLFWRGGFQGLDERPAPWGWTFTTDPIEGGVAVVTTSSQTDLSHRGFVPNVDGRKYRVTVRIKSTSTTAAFYLYLIRVNSKDTNAIETPLLSIFNTTATFTDYTFDFDGAASSRGAYQRILVRPFSTNGSAQTFTISRIKLEDITESSKAAASSAASATSASNAATSKTGADQAAAASLTSATNAQTARGQAETFANQASSSKDTASGFASTATQQAGVAASAATSANARLAESMPSQINATATGWTSNDSGSPSAVSPISPPLITFANSRYGVNAGSSGYIRSVQVLPATSGAIYEVTAEIELTYGSGQGFAYSMAVIRGLDAAYNGINETRTYGGTLGGTPSTAVKKAVLRVSDVADASRNILAWPAGSVWLRIGGGWAQDVVGSSGRTLSVAVRDITAELNSAKSASAAAGSASTAAAAQTAAGQSSTAAQASETNARTEAGKAAVSSSNAATSESSALGFKNAAQMSATVSASAALDAAGAAVSGNSNPGSAPSLWTYGWASLNPSSSDSVAAGIANRPTQYSIVNGRFRSSNNAQAHIGPTKATPYVKGHRYRWTRTSRGIVTTDAGDYLEGLVVCFDKAGTYLGYSFLGGPALSTTADTTVTYTFGDGTTPADFILLGNSDQATRDSIAWFRPVTIARGAGTNNGAVTEVIANFALDVESELVSSAAASAASTSASSAAASQTAAGQSASAAKTSETNAGTSAGTASVKATEAATSASNAVGYSNSASTSQALAASSVVAAKSAALATIPQTFDPRWWMNDVVYGDDPRSYPDTTYLTTVAGGFQLDGSKTVSSKFLIPVTTGNTYEITVDYEPVSGNITPGYGRLFANQRNAQGLYVGGQPGLACDWTRGNKITFPFAVDSNTSTVNLWILMDYTGATNASVKTNFKKITVVDVTARDAAKAAATAAVNSTASASTSKDAAGISANAAKTSETNANTSAGTALTKASEASTSASTALGYSNSASSSQQVAATNASTATQAKTDAVAAKDQAAQSASAAAGSASTASTKADTAGVSASAAKTSETNAGTAAGSASTSASQASTSATNALGSANSATTQAGVAATSATQAMQTAASEMPSDFSQGDLFWMYGWQGSSDVRPIAGGWTFPTVAGEGIVAQGGTTGQRDISHRGVTPLVFGRKYRATVRAKGSSAQSGLDIYDIIVPSQNGISNNATPLLGQPNLTTSFSDYTYDFTPLAGRDPYHRILARAVSRDGSAQTIQISRISLADVTSELAARDQASASASSASSAAASKTGADQSASAANTAKTNAETAAGNASTFAGQASTSASNASGSANTASTQAGLASTAKTAAETAKSGAEGAQTAAAGSASAANTSAGIASSSATAAGTSATAANLSKIDAQAANAAALASAQAANTSSVNANASASAASSSATLSSSFASSAITAVAPTIPSKFGEGKMFWRREWANGPSRTSDLDANTWTFVNGAAAFYNPGAGNPDISHLGAIPFRRDRKYRLTAKWLVIDAGGQTSVSALLYVIGMNGAYTSVTTPGKNVVINSGETGWGDGPNYSTATFDLNSAEMASDVVFIRGLFRLSQANGNQRFRLESLTIEDVTAEKLAGQALSDSAVNTASISTLSDTVTNGLGSLATRATTLEAKVASAATSFIVVSTGAAGSGSRFAGLYTAAGVRIGNVPTRSYNLFVKNPNDDNWFSQNYDVYGDANARAAMANVLMNVARGQIVVVTTYDEPNNGHTDAALVAGMQRCGAGPLFTSPNFRTHGAYILVGTAGGGYGSGSEYYAGSTDTNADAYLEKTFSKIGNATDTGGAGLAVRDLTARVSVTEGALATLGGRNEAYLVQDVSAGNGRAIVSLRANGVAGSSNIDLAASQIRLINSSGGILSPTLSVQDGNVSISGDLFMGSGRIVSRNGNFMKVQGSGFGSSNQFLEWYGPTKSTLEQCTEALAITYLRKDGQAYFGGMVAEGQLRTIKTTYDNGNSQIANGPLVTNGKPRTWTTSLSVTRTGTRVSTYAGPSGWSATFIIEQLLSGNWVQRGDVGNLVGYTYQDANNGVANTNEPSNFTQTATGSQVFVDNSGGTDPFQVRARITSISTPGPSGSSGSKADQYTQILSINTYEV